MSKTLEKAVPAPADDRAEARDQTDPSLPTEEIYTPIEAAIDREAESAVCSCRPESAEKKPIVSVNGRDVEHKDERAA